MTAPSPSELAQAEVLALGRALKAHIRSQGHRMRRVSEAMGRSLELLPRALAGTSPLKLKDVLGIFTVLGEHPLRFFERRYPLGGSVFGPDARARLREVAPDMPRFDGLIAVGQRLERAPAVDAAVQAAGLLLRRLIVEQGWQQRRVSQALGLRPDTLGQALRGGMDLEMWHIFGVLAVIEVGAPRFFQDLLAPGDSLAGATWNEMVRVLERLLSGAGPALVARLAGAPKASPPPAGGAGKGSPRGSSS